MTAGLTCRRLRFSGCGERAVERLRVQVIDVPPVALILEAVRELPAHQRLQEVAHVFAETQARKREVLPPEVIAAVQRGRHQKTGLPRREPERREGGDAFVEGHAHSQVMRVDRPAASRTRASVEVAVP